MDDSKFIFSTTDVLGRRVILECNTWDKHIIKRHPEMGDNIDSIKDTIENPDIIYESAKEYDLNRDVFFSKQPNSTYPFLYTKVIVEYNNSMGEITTAMFSKKIDGVKEGGIKYVNCKF